MAGGSVSPQGGHAGVLACRCGSLGRVAAGPR